MNTLEHVCGCVVGLRSHRFTYSTVSLVWLAAYDDADDYVTRSQPTHKHTQSLLKYDTAWIGQRGESNVLGDFLGQVLRVVVILLSGLRIEKCQLGSNLNQKSVN